MPDRVVDFVTGSVEPGPKLPWAQWPLVTHCMFYIFLHPLRGFLTSYDILCAFLAAPVSDRSTPRAGCAAVSLPLPLSLPRELQPSFVTISVVVDVGGGIIARPEEELFPPWAPWLAKCKWTLDFVEVHSLALIWFNIFNMYAMPFRSFAWMVRLHSAKHYNCNTHLYI